MTHGDPPPPAECAEAFRRALTFLRNRYRGDPAYAHPGALEERVDGVLGRPERGPEGVWRIGRIVDAITNDELDVYYRAQPRRLALGRRVWRDVAPRRPTLARVYLDRRRGWINVETGEPPDDETLRRALGPRDASRTPQGSTPDSRPRPPAR